MEKVLINMANAAARSLFTDVTETLEIANTRDMHSRLGFTSAKSMFENPGEKPLIERYRVQ